MKFLIIKIFHAKNAKETQRTPSMQWQVEKKLCALCEKSQRSLRENRHNIIYIKNMFFKIFNYLKYKLLARHRKGFSVHSPFVFELLNNVFFEKEYYYCYEKIEKIVAENSCKFLCFNKLKYYKLFFRLANYFNAKKILIVGKNNFIEKFFTFASSKMQILKAENISDFQNTDFDIIFFAENSLEKYNENIFSLIKNNSVLIFENIYQNKKNNEIWQNIIKDNNLKISIDIFNFGIIIAKNDIPKQHYKVAF